MSKQEQVTKLISHYQSMLESDSKLPYEIDKIDYFLALLNGPKEHMFKLLDCNSIMYRYTMGDLDGVIIIFSIPSQNNVESTSGSSSKIMELLKIIEEAFVTVDYMACEELKDDKFIYYSIFVRDSIQKAF